MNDFSRPRPGKSSRRSLRPCPLTLYPSDRFEIQIGAARLIRNMRWTCALSRALAPTMDQQTKDPDLLNVLVLERVDRTKNMARYYVLSVEPTSSPKSSLVRRWGRIGGAGRTRNRPSCIAAARAYSAQHMARTQAAPRVPTPRLIAGSRVFAGVLRRDGSSARRGCAGRYRAGTSDAAATSSIEAA